jgi:hypothetical protein
MLIEKRIRDQVTPLNFSKKKKEYKERRWPGHSYEHRVDQHLLYTVKLYEIAFSGNVCPSRETLARNVGVHRNTIDKSLKKLSIWECLEFVSGKQTYETNTYFIADCYKNQPIARPDDYKIETKLWFALNRIIKKQDWERKQRVYEHLVRDIVHHFFQKRNFLRTLLRKNEENQKKKGHDPPKKRKRVVFGHLLKPFKLCLKDQAILSRFGERSLYLAIDDLKTYLSWKRKVSNVAAFLISRCKYHREQLLLKRSPQTPNKINWLKDQFTKVSNLKFIQAEEEVDRADDANTFVKFLIHKTDPKQSKIFFWKKVEGYWVDKKISIQNDRFQELVMEFLA